MNVAKCEALKARCSGLGDTPIISADEFFDGNDDEASIGCNLDEHPGIVRFASTLLALKATPGVKEVLVQISEVDPGEENWPFADTVCVVGEVDGEAIRRQVAPLRPTDVEQVGLLSFAHLKGLAKAKNSKVTVVFWD